MTRDNESESSSPGPSDRGFSFGGKPKWASEPHNLAHGWRDTSSRPHNNSGGMRVQERRWTTIDTCQTFSETHALIRKHRARRHKRGSDAPINRARRYRRHQIHKGASILVPDGWAIKELR